MRLIVYMFIFRPPDDEKAVNAVYSSDLHDLLRQADVILITCQLNQASQRLIGKNEFRIMKPSAILVNVARGILFTYY